MTDTPNPTTIKAIVIGVSAGGVAALKQLLGYLPANFPVPLLVVQHTAPDSGNALAVLLDDICAIRIKEAEECETLQPGVVYLSPANYHLLVESDCTLALSIDPPVSFARPSIDVLFESAALAYGPDLIGVILTGANADGSRGLKKIKEKGGLAIVQDPADALVSTMPQAALEAVQADYIVPLAQLGPLLCELLDKPTSIQRKCQEI
jgi:two-component system chemotaxis response regulator CheB